MILPSKHISQDRALLTIGAVQLKYLNTPKTVSALWEDLKTSLSIDYDWFVLSLDFLYSMGVIDLQDGLIFKAKK